MYLSVYSSTALGSRGVDMWGRREEGNSLL